jgi:hypothetical protein
MQALSQLSYSPKRVVGSHCNVAATRLIGTATRRLNTPLL